jgi:RimJ/RimL family protein N-acetyltransferase
MKRRYSCLPVASVSEGYFSLTTVQDAHIDSIRQWRNAQLDVLRQAACISSEQQERYFEREIWPRLTQPHPNNVLLVFLERERPVGYGGLVHIAWEHARAEVSFLLDPILTADIPTYSRYFSTYLDLLKRLAFDGLRLHRLFTETFANRTDHICVLEANRFRLEGRLREHVRIGGTAVDSLIHGCLNDER